jgi:hypothetical protein
MPPFQMLKSAHPVRRGICVTEVNDLGAETMVVEELCGTEKVSA